MVASVESLHIEGHMATRKVALFALLLALAGCTLYNEVSISPLILTPASIDRGSDVQGMVAKADYLRAIEFTNVVETRSRKNAADLTALGTAELASGRYDEARHHLRAALDLQPFRETAAHVE